MKKKRKISIAWFLFFGALSYLLLNQWETITAVLAGVMIAWWITSRIKIKLLYASWIIFPVLSLIYINPVGSKAVGWCEENNPSVVKNKIIHYFEKVDNGTIQNIIDEFPKVKQKFVDSTKDKIKAGFQKSISFSKNLSKRLFTNPAPNG